MLYWKAANVPVLALALEQKMHKTIIKPVFVDHWASIKMEVKVT